MSSIVLERYTPEQLLAIPDGDRFELVDGRLVERQMGFHSSRVGGTLYRLLSVYCDEHALGWPMLADTSYQCFPHAPSLVCRPDFSFIRRERMTAEQEPEGHCPLAPDLVAEVISPNDLTYDTDKRVSDYLKAKVQLVWVLHPVLQSVDVHRADGSGNILRADHELDGERVIPGFRVRVGDLFLPPRGTAAAS